MTRDGASAPAASALAPGGLPRLPAGAITRPRVVELLARVATPVVSVVAPGGYGKTTALAQWVREDRRVPAWLTVAERHNDPVVLLAALLRALAPAGLAGATLQGGAARSTAPWPDHAAELAGLLSATASPVIVVLDDAHRLHDEAVLGMLGTIARGVDPASRLVFSGRSELTAVIARERAEGRVTDIGPGQLALTDDETARLLRALGRDDGPRTAAALTRHAEGWAAGIYLTGLAGWGSGEVPGPSGAPHRHVSDYLWSEHLSSLSQDEVEFLVECAVLQRFSAGMCDAVLGRTDSAVRIERAERGSLFVVPLDDVRRWYRFHDLFRSALRRELDRRDPAAAGSLLRRASDWCAANDLGDEAMAYAMEAGDEARMTRLFAGLVLPFYRAGRIATIEAWLSDLDRRGLIDTHPEVAVLGGVLHVFRGRPILADRWLDTAVRVTESRGPRDEQDPLLIAWTDLCRMLMCRGGPAEVRDLGVRALGSARSPAVLAPPMIWATANAAALIEGDGELDGRLEEAARAAESTGGIMTAVAARGQLAARALERGDRDRARDQVATAGRLVSSAPFDGYVEVAILRAAEAHLFAIEGGTAAANRALATAERLRPLLSRAFPVFSVHALLEMTRAHLALGDPTGARDCLAQAERIVSQSALIRLGELCAGMRALVETAPADANPGLTAAEIRLLPLLATHLTLKEIGARLFVSRNTVKTQATSIYRKLGASSRSEAIARATAAGLIEGPAGAGAHR